MSTYVKSKRKKIKLEKLNTKGKNRRPFWNVIPKCQVRNLAGDETFSMQLLYTVIRRSSNRLWSRRFCRTLAGGRRWVEIGLMRVGGGSLPSCLRSAPLGSSASRAPWPWRSRGSTRAAGCSTLHACRPCWNFSMIPVQQRLLPYVMSLASSLLWRHCRACEITLDLIPMKSQSQHLKFRILVSNLEVFI